MLPKDKPKKTYNGKCCPDCGEYTLVLIECKTEKDGVEYSEKIRECTECGYSEKFHISQRHFKDVFNPNW